MSARNGHSAAATTATIEQVAQLSQRDRAAGLRSYRSLLFKFWTFCVFEPPFGGLETKFQAEGDVPRQSFSHGYLGQ